MQEVGLAVLCRAEGAAGDNVVRLLAALGFIDGFSLNASSMDLKIQIANSSQLTFPH